MVQVRMVCLCGAVLRQAGEFVQTCLRMCVALATHATGMTCFSKGVAWVYSVLFPHVAVRCALHGCLVELLRLVSPLKGPSDQLFRSTLVASYMKALQHEFWIAGNAGKTGTSADASNDAPQGVNTGTGSNKPNSATTGQGDDSEPSDLNRKLSTSSTRRRRLSVIPGSKVWWSWSCR